MKEAFEDRMTKRIKEVLEHYEPEYSPQAWIDFRKQKLQNEFWLKRFFLRYPYWFDGIIITLILIIVSQILYPSIPEKENAVISRDPDTTAISESVIYPGSEKTEEVFVLEAPVTINQVDSKAVTASVKESISFNYLPAMINDTLPANYGDMIPDNHEIKGIPYSVDKIPAGSDSFRREVAGNKIINSKLVPSEIKAVNIPDLKSHLSERTGKSRLQLPHFSWLKEESGKYNKFKGPNKLAIFYSPEIQHNDSLKTIGISQGVGIIFEGPVRSTISISAGLSYQSMNYKRTISSGQVLHSVPPLIEPIDSTIIKSVRYKYFELPVSVNLKCQESTRTQVWIGTGISAMAFLGQNYDTEVIFSDTCKNSDDVFKKIHISAYAWKNIHPLASINFNLLYRFHFTDRLFLHSSVQYKLHLVPLGYNSMKLNRLNLQIGLGYRFGRYD